MPFEKFDLENLDKERRKGIAKSIRTISVEELKKLGGELFRYADDPWRETFFRFIAENPGATRSCGQGAVSFSSARIMKRFRHRDVRFAQYIFRLALADASC